MKSKNSFGHILVQDLNMLFPEDSSYIPDVNLIVNSIADQSTLDQTIYLRIGTSQREAAKLGGYSRASGNESPVCPWPKKIRCQISLCVCATIPHAILNRIVWSDLTLCQRTTTRDFDQHGCTMVSETHCHSWVSLTVDAGVWRGGRTPGITMAEISLYVFSSTIWGISRVGPQSLLVSKKKRSDFVLRMKVWRFCMSQYNRIDTYASKRDKFTCWASMNRDWLSVPTRHSRGEDETFMYDPTRRPLVWRRYIVTSVITADDWLGRNIPFQVYFNKFRKTSTT